MTNIRQACKYLIKIVLSPIEVNVKKHMWYILLLNTRISDSSRFYEGEGGWNEN